MLWLDWKDSADEPYMIICTASQRVGRRRVARLMRLMNRTTQTQLQFLASEIREHLTAQAINANAGLPHCEPSRKFRASHSVQNL